MPYGPARRTSGAGGLLVVAALFPISVTLPRGYVPGGADVSDQLRDLFWPTDHAGAHTSAPPT